MTQEQFDQLVQDRYRQAIATHRTSTMPIIELQARVEFLERGETIEAAVE